MMRAAAVLLAVWLAVWAGLAGPAAAQDLPAADIYVLGEVHDNPAHHAVQARLAAAIGPAALVFEMLDPGQADAAQGVPRHDAKALGAALAWDGSGWPDFAMYHPIFAAAPDARLYGAALDRATLALAREDGAAAAFGTAAEAYGLGPLDPSDRAAREADQAAAHCDMLPAALLPGMVEVQRLRDAHFARVAVAAHDETGGPVVVIAGNGHARTDIGIPAHLAAARPDLRVVALGQFEDAAEPDAPYDVTAVSPAIPRDDPCDAFRQ